LRVLEPVLAGPCEWLMDWLMM